MARKAKMNATESTEDTEGKRTNAILGALGVLCGKKSILYIQR